MVCSWCNISMEPFANHEVRNYLSLKITLNMVETIFKWQNGFNQVRDNESNITLRFVAYGLTRKWFFNVFDIWTPLYLNHRFFLCVWNVLLSALATYPITTCNVTNSPLFESFKMSRNMRIWELAMSLMLKCVPLTLLRKATTFTSMGMVKTHWIKLDCIEPWILFT